MNMNTPFVILALLAAAPLFSQTEKGAQLISQSPINQSTNHQTRAVVVGISNYQSPQIPDLKFADKDAEAFAAWLQSLAGGNVPADNIQLLTNEKATNSAVILALYGLLRTAQPGEQVIIYFSGHGDVESVLRGQPGFLLTYDTPPSVYMAGAVNLHDLQEVVSTLAEKQVKTILITDACHAGKLAGSLNNGTQATAMSLSQRFANEVKIMSCQPNEFSAEGPQWGGGRGVFSFYLLKALTGLADKNSDGTVNLFETNRYLQDVVPAQTSATQMPFTVGDLQTPLAQVDAPSLALLREEEAHGEKGLDKIGMKGLEEEVLAKTDSATRRQFADFKNALAAHDLLEPADRCAWDLYQKLAANPKLEPLLWMMQRNLAVALLDEVQQALNALIGNDPYEADNWKYNPAKYRQFPDYLQRAMDLLGEQHPIYHSLLAKKLFFEGYNLARNMPGFEKPVVRDSFRANAKAKYLQSLAVEPSAAYVCYSLASLNDWQGLQIDSFLTWMQAAVDRSPSWLLPYLDAAETITAAFNDVPRAEAWLLRAKEFHPESYLLLIRLAWLNQWKNDPEAANAICRELAARRPDLREAWATLARTQFAIQNDWVESQKSSLEVLKLDPNDSYGYWLALSFTNPDSVLLFDKELPRFIKVLAFIKLGRLKEAEALLQKLLGESIGYVEDGMQLHTELGRVMLLQGRLDEAEAELEKAREIAEGVRHWVEIRSLALLGEVKSGQQRPREAEDFYKKAVTYPFCFDQNQALNDAHFLYGRFLAHQNRAAEAQIQFENARKISPKTWHYPLGMALLAAQKGQKTAALDWLEKALGSFYLDKWAIEEEPLFSKIRKTKRFKAMMLKNFPPGWEEK